jgi:hypothetical protein
VYGGKVGLVVVIVGGRLVSGSEADDRQGRRRARVKFEKTTDLSAPKKPLE